MMSHPGDTMSISKNYITGCAIVEGRKAHQSASRLATRWFNFLAPYGLAKTPPVQSFGYPRDDSVDSAFRTLGND